MKIKLSICIPNYNRPDFLYKNLYEIGKQANEQVEVCVSDDCSSESVDDVIKKIKTKFPKLKLSYKKQKTNLGFDRNVLFVVEMAKGEYCWLLSNDDVLMPRGVERVIKYLKSNAAANLLLVNYRRFDKVLNQVTAERMIDLNKDIYFEDRNEFWFYKTNSSYFKNLGVNTLTMSCNVFKRAKWLECAKKVKEFIGHNFIHVFVISEIILSGDVGFISKPQVSYLSNNHRTWPNDIWKDYNNILLAHLRDIGYDKSKVMQLTKIQKEYETREAITKNKPLMFVYGLLLKCLKVVKNLIK